MNSKILKKVADFTESKGERSFNQLETYNQMRSNLNVFYCWGSHNFKKVRDIGMFFEVNGHIHKGFVVIILGFMDTYNIYLLNKEGDFIDECKKDIYADELNNVIDSLIETS